MGISHSFSLRNPDDVRHLFPSLSDAEVADFVREEEEFATVTRSSPPMVITDIDFETKTITFSSNSV